MYPNPQRWVMLSAMCLVATSGAGCCVRYATPRGPAEMSMFWDREIEAAFKRQPAAGIPAHVATARVQAPGYRSHTAVGYGRGRYSIVTVRDVETDEDFQRLLDLPGLLQVAPLNRLLVGPNLETERDLRKGAAALHADMILVYTFDTDFYSNDALRPLTVITLGLSPNRKVKVTTTVSGILVDVRTGFVYGACEGTAQSQHIASAWTDEDTTDRARRKTERAAFEDFLGAFESLWRTMAQSMPERTAGGLAIDRSDVHAGDSRAAAPRPPVTGCRYRSDGKGP